MMMMMMMKQNYYMIQLRRREGEAKTHADYSLRGGRRGSGGSLGGALDNGIEIRNGKQKGTSAEEEPKTSREAVKRN